MRRKVIGTVSIVSTVSAQPARLTRRPRYHILRNESKGQLSFYRPEQASGTKIARKWHESDIVPEGAKLDNVRAKQRIPPTIDDRKGA